MKRLISIVLAVVLLASIGGVALADKPGSTSGDPEYKGNKAPSGPHYTLNILGKTKEMPQQDCNTGNRIFRSFQVFRKELAHN